MGCYFEREQGQIDERSANDYGCRKQRVCQDRLHVTGLIIYESEKEKVFIPLY